MVHCCTWKNMLKICPLTFHMFEVMRTYTCRYKWMCFFCCFFLFLVLENFFLNLNLLYFWCFRCFMKFKEQDRNRHTAQGKDDRTEERQVKKINKNYICVSGWYGSGLRECWHKYWLINVTEYFISTLCWWPLRQRGQWWVQLSLCLQLRMMRLALWLNAFHTILCHRAIWWNQ